MVSVTSLIASIAFIASLANAFKLQVRHFRKVHHLENISIADDGKLVIGGKNKPADFSLTDGLLSVSGSDKIVHVSNADGTAFVLDKNTEVHGKYGSVNSHGFSSKKQYFEWNKRGAWAEKQEDGSSVIHWDTKAGVGHRMDLIFVVAIED